MVDDGKVAGILPESSIGADGKAEHVILGIGVNVSFAPEVPEMRYRGACLGGTVEAALERLAAALARRLAQWRRDGFASIRTEWLVKAGPLGLEVDVRLGDELVRGRFAGMDGEGALLLDTAAGTRRIVAGELLARAA
jgi:BirA family biotin operon repressor/biotin-[acetyl-CoA-carboxylase] ligase